MNINKLNTLISQATDFEAGDRDQFQALIIAAIDAFEQLQIELADEFGVNPSSVSRWKTGKVAPHPLSQKTLATWLVSKAQAQLAQAPAGVHSHQVTTTATKEMSMMAKGGS